MTETMWFVRDKQSPGWGNRLLCINGEGKYRAFDDQSDCAMFIASMPNPHQYEPIELEVED